MTVEDGCVHVRESARDASDCAFKKKNWLSRNKTIELRNIENAAERNVAIVGKIRPTVAIAISVLRRDFSVV
jgi:hypothetical protein